MKGFVCVILAFCWVCHGLLENEVCPRRHHALLIALLPLHGGFDCREWMQKGVQQRVALETAIEEINTENDLQIGLKILDTCSNRKKAAEAARKAIEFAEKRCSKFPVFLGFLGPDDEESLRGVLGMFKYPQVAPLTAMNFHHTAINVDVIDVSERARRISSFIKYLNWRSFILIFTSDTISSEIAVAMLESNDFCLTNSVLRIPSFASGKKNREGINQMRKTLEGVENVRVVILTDDPDVMDYFTDYVDGEWGDFEYVVYTQTSGILPWKSSSKMSRNAIILHEVPKSPLILSGFEDILRNSTLWSNYVNQLGVNPCDGCKPEPIMIDPTIVPYVYSIHLFSRALKTATRKKCDETLICYPLKTMSPQEWKTILENTVTIVNSNRVRFYMELETQINIILPVDNTTEHIGYIADDLILRRPGALKRLNRTKAKQCLVDMYEYELEQEEEEGLTTWKPEESTADEEKIPLNFGYNELMATVIGFPIGLVILISLSILCVYKSLRDGSGKSNLSQGGEDYS